MNSWYVQVLGIFKTPGIKFHKHLFRVRVVACVLLDRPTDVMKLLDPFLGLFVANAPKSWSVAGRRTPVIRSVAIYCQLVREQKDVGLTVEEETCVSSHRVSCWLPNRTYSIVLSYLFLYKIWKEAIVGWREMKGGWSGTRPDAIIEGEEQFLS